MNLELIWNEIQKLPSLILKINARDKEAVGVLYSLYKTVYGERVKLGCSNCHIKAYQKLTSLTFQNLKAMSEQKFKLKKGIVLDPENDGTHYTNANLTDEIAAALLKKNPALAKHFEATPKAEKTEEKKTEAKVEAKEEAKKA